jgi:HlyD family secretion protein
MRRGVSLLVLLTSSLLAACVSSSGGADPKTAPNHSPQVANEWEGTAVPAEGTAIAIWPEAYAGELILLDVLPHGTRVRSGEVIAHLDTRAIDDELRNSDFEVSSDQMRVGNAEQKLRVDLDAAASTLEQARSGLDRSRRALEGWEKQELEFSKRNAELEDRHRVAGIDDQTDELAQLEKMYKADELIDATEEIVLKRSRRGLDLSKTGLALARDQREYEQKIEEAMKTEAKREAVHVQEAAVERLVRSQSIDALAADDALQRLRVQLGELRRRNAELERDRELLTVKAPRDGILLHGSLDEYRPKLAPPRFERGSRLVPRTKVFTVADPEKLVVAVDVPESKLGTAHSGSAVELHPVFDPKLSASGKLSIDELPQARSGPTPENDYEGTIVLDHAIAGLRTGMRVKVKLAADDDKGATKSGDRVSHRPADSGDLAAAASP